MRGAFLGAKGSLKWGVSHGASRGHGSDNLTNPKSGNRNTIVDVPLRGNGFWRVTASTSLFSVHQDYSGVVKFIRHRQSSNSMRGKTRLTRSEFTCAFLMGMCRRTLAARRFSFIAGVCLQINGSLDTQISMELL